jgi:hypothetical protein
MTDLQHFLRKIQIQNLRRAPFTAKATWKDGDSPYKVVLLMSVIMAMHMKKAFRSGIVYFNDCVPLYADTYSCLYGLGSAEPLKPKVVQPFWYFGSGQSRIWDLIPKDGMTTRLKRSIAEHKQIKTTSQLDTLVECAEFSSGDYDLLQSPLAARAILFFLAGEYFSESQKVAVLVKQFRKIG